MVLLSWVQFHSDNFVVTSNEGSVEAIRMAGKLETFHATLASLFSRDERRHDPVEVVLLDSDKQFRKIIAENEAQEHLVMGMFQGFSGHDFILLRPASPQIVERTMYHELTHHFLSHSLVSCPAWLNEGLSQYFERTEIGDRKTRLGHIDSTLRQSVQRTARLPIIKLLKLTETDVRSFPRDLKVSFYTQSLAFVHFLLHGKHAPAFRNYVQALGCQDVQLLDFVRVSISQLEREYADYLYQLQWNSELRRTNGRADYPKSAAIESISEADLETKIAEILLWRGDFDRARAQIDATVLLTPHSVRLNRLRATLGRFETARAAAAASAP